MQDFSPKGYLVPYGYMGWAGDRYQLFPTEAEYIEYLADSN